MKAGAQGAVAFPTFCGTQMSCLLTYATEKRACDNGTRIPIAAHSHETFPPYHTAVQNMFFFSSSPSEQIKKRPAVQISQPPRKSGHSIHLSLFAVSDCDACNSRSCFRMDARSDLPCSLSVITSTFDCFMTPGARFSYSVSSVFVSCSPR